MARSEIPSIFPSFERSYLNPRTPRVYSPLIDNVFATFLPSLNASTDLCIEDEDHLLGNRIYYIEGEQLKSLQLLASENGCRRSKLVAFTSFLWKNVALSLEDSGKDNAPCNVVVTVDGRRRLGEGGEDKEKLMASHFGNVVSMPFGSQKPQVMNLFTRKTQIKVFVSLIDFINISHRFSRK